MQKAKQFLTKHLAVRLLPLLLAGWFAQSCNNSVVVEEEPPPPATVRVNDSLPIYSKRGILLPDSASWKMGKDSGDASFVVVADSVVSTDGTPANAIVAARLVRKTLNDTLKIRYWKFGILIQTRLYVADGSDANDLPDYAGKVDQFTNSLLLANLDIARKSADSAKFPLNRTGFVAAYASLIISGSTKANFPDSLPAQISKDTIQDIVIKLAFEKKMLAKDLANLQIGMTPTQITVRIEHLITIGFLDPKAKDSFYPPSTIKWEEAFGVEGTSVKQAIGLGLKGKVTSGTKWASRSIEILNKDKRNVSSQFAITMPTDSTTLIFTGVAKLIPSADLGSYTVRFSAKNEKGDSTSADATFEVVKSDDTTVVLAPQITRLQPSGKDSLLDFGTEKVIVKWKVKDAAGIAFSTINGMEASLVKDGEDSVYAVEIKLAPGKDSVVWLKSTSNSKKFSVDSVLVRRAKDGEKPKFERFEWAFDTALNNQGYYQFGKDEVTVTMKWLIEDNFKLHPETPACILSAGKVVRCLDVQAHPKDATNPLKGLVAYDYVVPNLASSIILRVMDAAGNFEDHEVDFVRPQKEGDILAEWDRFNWDAPRVVWQ
ncbi:MAG: hypothetical protein IPN71_03085 [Fibrobacteres bacterium]|nr:hypothetical protein [Fibrobacterota bacterium]